MRHEDRIPPCEGRLEISLHDSLRRSLLSGNRQYSSRCGPPPLRLFAAAFTARRNCSRSEGISPRRCSGGSSTSRADRKVAGRQMSSRLGQRVGRHAVMARFIYKGTDLSHDVVALLLQPIELVVPIVGPCTAVLPRFVHLLTAECRL